MFVCPLCRLTLGDAETTCPRDGHEATAARPQEVPAVVRARFTIVQPYAQGDSGDLYLVDDQQTGRRGVLKMLRTPASATPAERARLKRELVKQETLTNPVLSVPLATGDGDGAGWLFREWHEGVSLRVKLSRGGALPVPEALSIASQIAVALDELHRSGLLHRDVKPGHVILNPQPSGLARVTVIDAGVAAHIETSSVFDVTGTPAYVSPEQAKGKLVSFRSDLYALGCVLFEMLTGTTPFDGTPAELLQAHAEKAAPTPQMSLPTGVSTLLAQLLAKDPRERPFSAQQVRRALAPFLPEDPTQKREATQTFERLSEKRRAPVGGRGTLRPPTSTKVGMPAAVPPPSQPPPPPKAALGRKPQPDATEELTALDLEEAEQIVEQASALPSRPPATSPAGHTEELGSIDLADAEEVLGSAREEDPAPPWQQTPLEDGLDYDDLAETKAVDREAAEAPNDAPAEAPREEAPAAEPARRKLSGARLVALLALVPLAGGCALFALGAGLGTAFIFGSDDEEPVAARSPAPVEPVPVTPPSEPFATPEAEAPEPAEVEAAPEATAPEAAAPEISDPPAEAEEAPEAPQEDERADEAPRERPARTEPRPTRIEQFNQAREQALAAFRARRFAQAAAGYQRATELNPRHAGSFSGLGASRLALGQHARAIRAYQRAIDLQPRHAGYHAALGRTYLAAGDRNRARQSFTRALALDPNNRSARQGLDRL